VDAWFDEVKKARWSGTSDVKRSYATASIVSAVRIVLTSKGTIGWSTSRRAWRGSNGLAQDYDRIEVKEVQHGG